jgi:hypothetical protein
MNYKFCRKTSRENTTLGPYPRWKGNIDIDLYEYSYEYVNWIRLAHDRIQWRKPVKTALKNITAFLGCDAVSFG